MLRYELPKNQDYAVNCCSGCLDKQRQIDRLSEEVERLKQKLRLNERKSQEGFFGLSTPSSQIPLKANSLSENQARRGGAQAGHPGAGRQAIALEEIEERRVAPVTAETCQNCQCQLVSDKNVERTVLDLVRQRVRKILYTVERKRCPGCRQLYRGAVENALKGSLLSNDLIAQAAQQHYQKGHSIGQIAADLGLNHSTLLESFKRLGQKLEPCLEKLKEDYRADEVRHADETGWRTDGGNGYSWYFGSQRVSLHLFRQTRSASVVKEVLGKKQLKGCLVVDRYSGYNQVPCEMQYCYAHLLREMKKLAQEFETNREVGVYTEQMKLHLSDAIKLRRREIDDAEYYRQAAEIKRRIMELSSRQAQHTGVRKWQDFFVEKAARLYQWCVDRRVPAENNSAERAIRKTVIARKISYGSQSESGAKTREIWTSVLRSLEKREDNPRDKLVQSLNKLNQEKYLNIAEELFGKKTAAC